MTNAIAAAMALAEEYISLRPIGSPLAEGKTNYGRYIAKRPDKPEPKESISMKFAHSTRDFVLQGDDQMMPL